MSSIEELLKSCRPANYYTNELDTPQKRFWAIFITEQVQFAFKDHLEYCPRDFKMNDVDIKAVTAELIKMGYSVISGSQAMCYPGSHDQVCEMVPMMAISPYPKALADRSYILMN